MGTTSYPKGSFILLAMTAFEAGAFAIFIVLNPIFWRESIGVGEKAAGDANFIYGFLLNFTPFITAFLADNYWGRYVVLGLHCVFFVLGFGLTTASSIISLPFSAILGGASLLLVSTAVGINKVILPTFNADQFPGHDEETRNKMFSWYYFAVNLASIVSILTVGNLKDFFNCYGKPCYPFVYGLCTALVLISAILFFSFTRWFIRAPASKNVLVEAVKCFLLAVKNKTKVQRKISLEPSKNSLLDYAAPTYSEKFIGDLKQALKVASLFFIGIPYWTCYQTMFSSWSRQYSMVDGTVGPLTLTFLMYIILDPITIVTSIFLQNSYIIPFLNKFTKVTPLKKMAAGGLFAALCYAFVMVVEYKITNDELKPLGTRPQVGYMKQSTIDERCRMLLLKNEASASALMFYASSPELVTVPLLRTGEELIDIDPGLYRVIFECPIPRNVTFFSIVQIQNGVNVFAFYPNNQTASIVKSFTVPYSRLENTKTGLDVISCRNNMRPAEAILISSGLQSSKRTVSLTECKHPPCSLSIDLKGKLGSRRVFFDDFDCSQPKATSRSFTEIAAVPGYSVSGLYMWPQDILFGLSESLLAVGALEFAYTQTSSSMKAFMQALWLLTAALGNILGFLLNQIRMSPFLSHFVQGGIMFLFTLIFIGAAWRYKYVEIDDERDTTK